MVEQGIFQYLASFSPLTTLINTTNGNGIYWALIPKGGSVPCIVLSRTSTTETYSMQGNLKFRGALLQFDCYGASYFSAQTVSNAVRQALDGLSNTTLPDGTVTGGALVTKAWDMPFEEGGRGFVFRALVEARVWYLDTSY